MAESGVANRFKAVITGATGATGKYLFANMIKCQEFSEIVYLGRRKATIPPEVDGINLSEEESVGRVKQEIIDMENLTNEAIGKHFENADIYLSCLGTTRKQSGSAERFKHIDHGYNYKLAKVAKENGVRIFSLMSTQGAEKSSMFLYLKVKGELEIDCGQLNFPTYVIFRPGILDRGGSARFLERFVSFFMPGISTQTVARAMCSSALLHLSAPANKNMQQFVYYNDHIKHMSDTYDLK